MGNKDSATCLAASQAVAEALRVDPARTGTLRLASALAEPQRAPAVADLKANPPARSPIVMIASDAGKALAVIPPVVATAHFAT